MARGRTFSAYFSQLVARSILTCLPCLAILLPISLPACGARSGLPDGEVKHDKLCEDGETQPCGSSVGACRPGLSTCANDTFGPCEGAFGGSDEVCNGVDDNCDGVTDEGFHLNEACDGPDNDVCLDDRMECGGCSMGPNIAEVCNGKDDNCNGIVDADCDQGDCEPTLLVTGSTPSSSKCIDFPVDKGSTGVIQFPCEGGAVSAQLGDVYFTGSVQNGEVLLTGTLVVTGPDDCIWRTDHAIAGSLYSGKLMYYYDELVIDTQGHWNCWQPCTESGVVEIQWGGAP